MAGLANFDTVLEGQRSLRVFEDQLVQSRSAITQNLIQLYKALGGGWCCAASPSSDEQLVE